MPTLKVVVPLLNQRSFPVEKTENAVNVIGKVKMGVQFESVEELSNSLGKWYKDRDGSWYWGGGLRELIQASISYPTWMIELGIPTIWGQVRGNGVGIGVIDTGIDSTNADLVYNKNDFYLYDSKATLKDAYGHGTHCASLIGARNMGLNQIGTAPESNLFICKISEDGFLRSQEMHQYTEAINWCSEQANIHIISISWGSFIDDLKTINAIQNAINSAVLKNKIVICAIGDASKFGDPGPLYPVCLDNTIGVGSIPIRGKLYPYVNKYLTIVINGNDIISYGKDNGNLLTLSGTSQSNAIVAGIVALMIQKNKFNYTPKGIKEDIEKLSVSESFSGISLPILKKELLLQYFNT